MQTAGKKPAARPTKTASAKSLKQDDSEQSKRFLDAARDVGAAETEKDADCSFAMVARQKKR